MNTALKVGCLTFFSSGIVVLCYSLAALFGPAVESRFFPVNTGFIVSKAWVEGEDLFIRGTMVKQRACEYIAPTQAQDKFGQIYAAKSYSKTAGLTWPVSFTPRPFGPWKFEGAANQELEIVQRHDCHPGWPTFTKLAVFSFEKYKKENQ